MTMDKLFDGSDAHLLPGNAELIEPPHEIICYALKVGDWFKERDITHWKIADCASRNALEAADKRIAELEQDCKDMGADYQSCGKELYETSCKLDEAHKRIAELEAELADRMSPGMALTLKATIREAERKLAVAREAFEELGNWDGDLVLKDFCEGVLALIGEDS